MTLSFFGSRRERIVNANNRGWVSRLLGCKPQPTAAEIYAKAQRAYMAAVARRDTREINRRFGPMQAALHAKMRAEVGR